MPAQPKTTNAIFKTELKRYLAFAEKIAREAGKILRDGYTKPREITKKGKIDLVTSVDLKSEKLVVSRIKSAYPSHSILGEENARIEKNSPFRWVIDPLDGTINFAHGYPAFCVSIGLQYNNASVVGVVYDPMRDELFSAILDSGARLNGKKIKIAQTADLVDALCATGFPYDTHESKNDNLGNFNRVMKAAQDIRRNGSAAIDLCYLACGRYDAYWEIKLSPWDTAAGFLIASEAGAVVTDFSGKPYTVESKEIAAANPTLHKQILPLLKY